MFKDALHVLGARELRNLNQTKWGLAQVNLSIVLSPQSSFFIQVETVFLFHLAIEVQGLRNLVNKTINFFSVFAEDLFARSFSSRLILL